MRRILYRVRKFLFGLAGGSRVARYPLGRITELPSSEQIKFVASEFAEALYVTPGGHRLLEIDDSLAGEPPAQFEISGKTYSVQFLYYFARAQWLLNNLTLPQGAGVVEVGPGYGGFIEVLRKLRPDLRIVLVDIAPQLYVAEQRAKAIFGESAVVGFAKTSKMVRIDVAALEPGQIAIVAPWDIDKLANIWLGVNHASMQEMTRAQAVGYIDALVMAGMQQFFLIHHSTGVILGPDAVTSEFLIDCLLKNELRMKAFGAQPIRDFATSGHPFHDYLLFAKS